MKKIVIFSTLALATLQINFIKCKNITEYNFPDEIIEKAQQLASETGNELLAAKIKEDSLHAPDYVYSLITFIEQSNELDNKTNKLQEDLCDTIYKNLYPSPLIYNAKQATIKKELDQLYFGEDGRNTSIIKLWLLIAKAEQLKILGDYEKKLDELSIKIANELTPSKSCKELDKIVQQIYINNHRSKWNLFSKIFSQSNFNSTIQILNLGITGLNFLALATIVSLSKDNSLLTQQQLFILLMQAECLIPNFQNRFCAWLQQQCRTYQSQGSSERTANVNVEKAPEDETDDPEGVD